MTAPVPPDSDATPPRGGAAYTMVDVGALAERAADRALEAVQISRRVEQKLDAWQRRRDAFPVAVMMIAICALAVSITALARIPSADAQERHGQLGR